MPDDYEDEEKEGLNKADEAALREKAEAGELQDDEEEIDETTIAFDPDLFKSLGEDAKGDKVVCVLTGKVISADDEAVVVEFCKASVVHGKMPPPGEGGRFKHLEHVFEGRGDVENPGGLAAYIGRKKYGSKKMAAWSAKGRREG